ncbi:MAG: alpha/beta fold hydrolase [Proteobacteria bacterium]|nr:alpha/beta fold hydrolase [Pseudomonadota bacterium]
MITGSVMAASFNCWYHCAMSWQYGQPRALHNRRSSGQGRPLAAMTAAVLGAVQKPFVEQGFKELLRSMENVPGDIDWGAFQAGVARYGAQEFVHPREDYPVLAREGRVVLRDAGGEGTPVVLVPSMVNRGYVLDLYPGQSLVGYLRAQGFKVLLVDWGDPGERCSEFGVRCSDEAVSPEQFVDPLRVPTGERQGMASPPPNSEFRIPNSAFDAPLGLEEVIVRRLEPLLRVAADKFGPVGLVGYCMGGLLALAAAVRLGPEVVGKLALAATPWDFQQTASAAHMQQGRVMLEPWVGGMQVLPGEVMAQYFWMLDPWGPIRRVMAYGREADAERLKFLTVLEDWLADGLGLDGPVAGEMLFDWYADNRALKGEWMVGGKAIRPGDLAVPLWVCITQKDMLVPTASSLPLIGQARGAQVVMADTGHVGLVCGRKAERAFYGPLAGWLKG